MGFGLPSNLDLSMFAPRKKGAVDANGLPAVQPGDNSVDPARLQQLIDTLQGVSGGVTAPPSPGQQPLPQSMFAPQQNQPPMISPAGAPSPIAPPPSGGNSFTAPLGGVMASGMPAPVSSPKMDVESIRQSMLTPNAPIENPSLVRSVKPGDDQMIAAAKAAKIPVPPSLSGGLTDQERVIMSGMLKTLNQANPNAGAQQSATDTAAAYSKAQANLPSYPTPEAYTPAPAPVRQQVGMPGLRQTPHNIPGALAAMFGGLAAPEYAGEFMKSNFAADAGLRDREQVHDQATAEWNRTNANQNYSDAAAQQGIQNRANELNTENKNRAAVGQMQQTEKANTLGLTAAEWTAKAGGLKKDWDEKTHALPFEAAFTAAMTQEGFDKEGMMAALEQAKINEGVKSRIEAAMLRADASMYGSDNRLKGIQTQQAGLDGRTEKTLAERVSAYTAKNQTIHDGYAMQLQKVAEQNARIGGNRSILQKQEDRKARQQQMAPLLAEGKLYLQAANNRATAMVKANDNQSMSQADLDKDAIYSNAIRRSDEAMAKAKAIAEAETAPGALPSSPFALPKINVPQGAGDTNPFQNFFSNKPGGNQLPTFGNTPGLSARPITAAPSTARLKALVAKLKAGGLTAQEHAELQASRGK